ncbi:hypothetical protein UA74_24070 [Actinoalloteichus fjordicus]|uniref:Uncharacterized protein n=1 Tax=Actinoalloteichus fjordicus TaxID=1612552 RepID=A0AAC9LHF6_9PSEU|nr:hypothetical protein UA74_24070 [Actinoalloteichus fjordicus]
MRAAARFDGTSRPADAARIRDVRWWAGVCGPVARRAAPPADRHATQARGDRRRENDPPNAAAAPDEPVNFIPDRMTSRRERTARRPGVRGGPRTRRHRGGTVTRSPRRADPAHHDGDQGSTPHSRHVTTRTPRPWHRRRPPTLLGGQRPCWSRCPGVFRHAARLTAIRRFAARRLPVAHRRGAGLVVVIHGRWLEAAGPEQAEVDAARYYALGHWESGFALWAPPWTGCSISPCCGSANSGSASPSAGRRCSRP